MDADLTLNAAGTYGRLIDCALSDRQLPSLPAGTVVNDIVLSDLLSVSV